MLALALAVALLPACARSAATGNSTSSSLNPTELEPNAAAQTALPPQQQPSITTPPELVPEHYYSTQVAEVVDGDTIVAEVAGQSWHIRLIGIDTPEDSSRERECGGAEATAFLRQLIPPGTEINLTRGDETYDIYDRLLAYVFRGSDGLFVNLALAKYGWASEFSFDQNLQYAQHFKQAETTARDNALGVWGQCGGTDTPL